MKETPKYNGWLVSDSFMKRCMAVTLYGMLGELIIGVGVLFIVSILFVIAGFLGMLLEI